MKIKILYALLIVLVGYGIVYAGGDGGGGGNCGKGGCGGGGGGSENAWRYGTIGPIVNPQLPGGLQIACGQNIFDASGTNTFPVIVPQAIGANEYFSQVLVQDLVTNEIRAQEYFIGSSSGPIQVPRSHSFRINVSVYARCSDCMNNLLVILQPGEGKRIIMNYIAEFPAGVDFIYSVPMVYSGLASCN